jgi:hypothetical protein
MPGTVGVAAKSVGVGVAADRDEPPSREQADKIREPQRHRGTERVRRRCRPVTLRVVRTLVRHWSDQLESSLRSE